MKRDLLHSEVVFIISEYLYHPMLNINLKGRNIFLLEVARKSIKAASR